jgi:predicted DNA-binding antitoxin AbrB/MazE fold protein
MILLRYSINLIDKRNNHPNKRQKKENPMERFKLSKSNLVNITVRVEEECLNELKLYSRVVGKSQSEILRELINSALSELPRHQRRAMEIIGNCKISS